MTSSIETRSWLRGVCAECGLISVGKGTLRCSWCKESQPVIQNTENAPDLDLRYSRGSRLIRSVGGVASSLGGLAVGAIAVVLVLGITLAIYLAMTALTGLDPTWEGPGGMPGTGDPTPVFGMIAFALAVTIVAKLGTGLRRVGRGAAAKLGMQRQPSSDPNESRLVGKEAQKQIVHCCLVTKRSIERATTKKRRTELLDGSVAEIWALAEERREWIVQVRERPARDDNPYTYPTKWRDVRQHLGEVLQRLDAMS